MHKILYDPQITYQSKNFLIDTKERGKIFTIDFKVKGKFVNTKYFPITLYLLETKLPSIMKSKCFNGKDLAFSQEVINTEIGHLFEHVFIEYLFLIRTSLGEKNVILNGRTFWNWKKNPRGSFSICVDCGDLDKNILNSAFKKSVELLEDIVNFSYYPSFPQIRADQ